MCYKLQRLTTLHRWINWELDKIWIHQKVKKWVENIKIYSRTRFSQIEFIHLQSFRFFHKSFFFVLLVWIWRTSLSVSNHENLTTWGMIEMYLIIPPSSLHSIHFFKVMDLFSNMTNLHNNFSREKWSLSRFSMGVRKILIVRFLSHLLDMFRCHPKFSPEAARSFSNHYKTFTLSQILNAKNSKSHNMSGKEKRR